MFLPYLHSDVIKNGKCLKMECDHYLLCDGTNHYHATPLCDIKPVESCWCAFAKNGSRPTKTSFPLNREKLARPRYEVYNKDPDFFHDHETGALIWLQLSSSPKRRDCYIEVLLTQIIELLNRKENESLLLSHQRAAISPLPTTSL